jgi:hypothetical protein
MSDAEWDPEIEEPPLPTFVRAYWQRRRGSALMPRRKDIQSAEMKAHLRNILLADVVEGGADFRYRLVGTDLQRHFASNPTGRLMSQALAGFGEETVARTIVSYRAVVERHAPLRIRGDGALYSQSAKLFDALLTPLSDDGNAVNMILGTFEFVWDFRVAAGIPGLVEPDEAALARVLAGR